MNIQLKLDGGQFVFSPDFGFSPDRGRSVRDWYSPRLSKSRTERPRSGVAPLIIIGFAWLAMLLLSAVAFAQKTGSVSGRVVNDDGKPLADVRVSISTSGADRSRGVSRSTTTDADGNFQFNNLPDRVYGISASAQKGYVLATPARLGGLRPGENVTITMMRGGVITGRVTDSSGDPLVSISVSAIRIRDHEDRKINASGGGTPRSTDDRGIYRLYGLQPGTYIVVANGGQSFVMPALSPFHGETPTYHPSSTRDTAAEVKVSSGSETAGVDIRYRGESGRTVSGKLSGAELTLLNTSASVSLRDATTGGVAASTSVQKSRDQSSFALQGVPDGEYELEARYGSPESDEMFASEPRRVTVRGADVTGLELRMLPLGSIAGRVVIEAPPATCDQAAKTRLEEIVLFARPEEKPKGGAQPIFKPNPSESPVNEKGEFTLNRLQPLRHRLSVNLPNENLYVKSIAVKAATPAAGDLARNGVTLKQGEKLTGVTVTLAEGAAGVRGKVQTKPPESSLPFLFHILALPAEADAAEDMLRYAEATVRQDGTFAFTNLAPGKYILVPTGLHINDPADRRQEFPDEKLTQLVRLRQDSESPKVVKVEVELKACQKVTDVILKISFAAK